MSQVLIAALAGAILIAGCGHPHRGNAGLNPEVIEALRSDGRANVVVALALPAGFDAEPGSDRSRAEIARVQEDVLGAIDPGDFELRVRFVAVPALAGTVLSEPGLRALAAHPQVLRVDLDVEGGGSEEERQ